MNCLVCNSEKEVKNLGCIYTIGSEGTDLCLDCRIMIAELLRKMMDIKRRFEITIKR